MKAIFFILKKTELLNNFIAELKNHGITGGTIIESKGIAQEIAEHDEFAFFGALRHLLTEGYVATNTLIFVANEEKEKIILDAIDKSCNGLSEPNTGIVFALPIEYCKGLKY